VTLAIDAPIAVAATAAIIVLMIVICGDTNNGCKKGVTADSAAAG